MFDLIASLLSWFYNIDHSYLLSIILLTFVVLVISTPLTLQGTRSMLKMQLLQPELKAIQNKYGKDEREEMNVEMMAFYKENNINPVGGCIPMLFQIPVFLVLYRVILGLTRRATNVGSQLGEVAGSVRIDVDASVVEASDTANFNPAYLDDSTKLFENLSATNEMNSLGFDLSRSASQTLGDGIGTALPYLLLVLIVGLSGWFQHQMIRKRQTGAPANPTQEMIMKFMPFFLPVFSFQLPAAIVFYFLVSNLYRIGQQYYITRSMYHGEDSLGGQIRKNREGGDGSNTKKSGANKAKSGSNKKKSNTKKSNKSKSKTSSAARTSAPGRNSSGRQASARANVQPKARKKKKR